MTQPSVSIVRVLFCAAAIALAGCSGTSSPPDEHAHDAEHAHEAEGPNGGRLITSGEYSLEIKIDEGRTARFVAWGYRNGKPLPAEQVDLSLVTERLGGASETFAFKAEGERLVASTEVGEPHSFVIAVKAEIGGQTITERFESFEGRTRLDAASVKEVGIVVAPVAAGDIAEWLTVTAMVVPRRGGEALVSARFPGVVRQIRAEVGDKVRKGETLAVIESDASLAEYSLPAPISGVVVSREARLGEATGGDALFVIVDLETLLLEMRVFGKDVDKVRSGAQVRLMGAGLMGTGDTVSRSITVNRISPIVDAASQSVVVQAELRNPAGTWRPGMAMRAGIEVGKVSVPLRVPVSALQKMGGSDVLFVRVGDDYEMRPVSLGRRNEEYAEVLGGIAAGDEIVVEQSYLIKADIEKSGAVHDH